MKQVTRRLFVAVLAVCMLASMLVMPAAAKTTTEGGAALGQRYNIMLVIDGSGSLISNSTTDPEGMRYELIDDLLGHLEDDGHYVGAVVFSGNRDNDVSDAAMESGILCNTGMISLDPRTMTPNGSLPKDYLSQQIRQAGVDKNRTGTTDIGTALLVAERELRKTQDQNGMESVIFLFTDGVTDIVYPEVKAKSDENLGTAIQEIRENGIRLFGAFLNKDSKLPNNHMTEIVCATNGIGLNSNELLNSYVELPDMTTCHQSVDILLKFLGYEFPDPVITTGCIEDEFMIPGVGIEEMNIRLYSYKGEDMPKMTVELTMPDGTVLSDMNLNAICRSGRTFRIYKLVKPMGGLWKLKVTVPENNKIAYAYSRVFSKYVETQLTVSPNAADLHVNADATFTAALAQNGVALADPTAYTGYECRLEIQNLADGTVTQYPISGNGVDYVHNMKLQEYGSYEAWAVFSCDAFEVASESIVFDLINHNPETQSPVYQELKYGLFQSEETELDLLSYVNDQEDGKAVNIALTSASCNADGYTYDQANKKLVLKNKEVGNGQLIFTVTDTQGASAELRVEVQTQNVTILYVIGLLLVLLLLFILFVIKERGVRNHKLDGDLTAAFELEIEGEPKSFSLLLPKPGQNHSSKTTLSELMKACLKDDTELHDRVPAETIKAHLKDMWGELDKVVVIKTATKVKGEKVGAVTIKDGKRKSTMPGKRSVEIKTSLIDISLTYTREEQEDDLFDEDLDFGAPKNKKKGKNKKRPDRDIEDFEDF